MSANYIKGLYRTSLIARFMQPISENQVDAIKENVTKYWEGKIDSLQLSPQEKDERKRQMKRGADAYNLGIKDALRMNDRLI